MARNTSATLAELQATIEALQATVASLQATPAKATPKAPAKPKPVATEAQKAKYAKLWAERLVLRKELKIVKTADLSAWAMDAKSDDPRMVKVVNAMNALSKKGVAYGMVSPSK